MKFEMNHKVGTDYSTVRFFPWNQNHKCLVEIEKIFQKLGGYYYPKPGMEPNLWKFPSYITAKVIEEVIHNTCFVCGGLMKDSTAFQNTLVSSDDFGNDSGQRGTTQSRVGEPQYLKVRKCESCGHSHT